MIVKLKNECGYQFTSKLEGMFTDMKISKVGDYPHATVPIVPPRCYGAPPPVHHARQIVALDWRRAS